MRKFIKKHYRKCLLGLLCIVCIGSLAACKGNGGVGDSIGAEESLIPLSLDKEQATLLIGDEMWLTANYTETTGNALDWSSDNDFVATVSGEGKVVANAVGEATITASYGAEKVSCKVSVGLGNMLPTIQTDEFFDSEERISVSLEDTLNVGAAIKFNDKIFDDAEWTYTLSDPTVGIIENGVFKPQKVGSTNVTVSGTWRGMSLSTFVRTMTIEVINSLKVVINDGLTDSVYLYTAATHGGKTYATSLPFVVSILENGESVDATVTVTEGTEIVAYDAATETVKALTYGKAEITVSFTDSDGILNTMVVPVVVERPVAEYGETISYFSAMDGELPITEIFGGKTNLIDAYQGENALTVTDGSAVIGVSTSNKGMQKTKIRVYNETVGYLLNLETYTKVIDEESDLAVFQSDQNGYFVLKNDIECTGSWSNQGTFSGTFDGQGFAIKNAKFSVDTNNYKGGLFGTIGAGAHIENVAILQADLSAYNAAVLAGGSTASYSSNSRIENVYIGVSKVGTRFGALMWQRGPWDTFSNVIVDMRAMDTATLSGNTYGALFACDNWAAANSGSSWNDDNKRVTNVYVLAKEGTSMMRNTSYGQWTATIYAGNEGIAEDAAARTYVYTGAKRYSSLEIMAAAVVKVGDDQNYWTVTETGIEWKGELPEIPTQVYGKTIKNFSALDGELPIAEIFGDENVVITDAYQSGTQLKVENNRVLGVATYSDRVTETQIIIYTARGNYILHLEAYTMILDEESDLSVFSTQEESVNGYFVLGKDILCTGETVWNNINVSRDRYFNGVLDGRGHKITGAKIGDNGLFGILGANAVIKNIAFTDITLTGRDYWKNTALLAHESLASAGSKSGIENVYVHISNFREADGGNRAAGLLYTYNADIEIKDVIVEIESKGLMERPQYGYGALFEHDKVKGEAGNLTNVYVVSELMPLAMHTQDNIATEEWDPIENAAGYAGNDKETAGKIDKQSYFYYKGVERYDDMKSLSQAVTQVGNWTISAEGVTWVESGD